MEYKQVVNYVSTILSCTLTKYTLKKIFNGALNISVGRNLLYFNNSEKRKATNKLNYMCYTATKNNISDEKCPFIFSNAKQRLLHQRTIIYM